MLVNQYWKRASFLGFLMLGLSGCFHPPYNNFQPDQRVLTQTLLAAGVGAGTGALIGSAAGNTAAGAVIGGAAGAAVGLYRTNQQSLIKELKKQDIQNIAYGDRMTLVVPTDRYFQFNSPELKDIEYPGLNNIIRLLKYNPNSPVYVAAFTDDIGTNHHKLKLSEAQAQAMLTFLWANNISAELLQAEGYGDKHTIGDNRWMHGSAYNRRIEIQWMNGSFPKPCKRCRR